MASTGSKNRRMSSCWRRTSVTTSRRAFLLSVIDLSYEGRSSVAVPRTTFTESRRHRQRHVWGALSVPQTGKSAPEGDSPAPIVFAGDRMSFDPLEQTGVPLD